MGLPIEGKFPIDDVRRLEKPTATVQQVASLHHAIEQKTCQRFLNQKVTTNLELCWQALYDVTSHSPTYCWHVYELFFYILYVF